MQVVAGPASDAAPPTLLGGVAADDLWVHFSAEQLVAHWDGDAWRTLEAPVTIQSAPVFGAARAGEVFLLGADGLVSLKSDGTVVDRRDALPPGEQVVLSGLGDIGAFVTGESGTRFFRLDGDSFVEGPAPPKPLASMAVYSGDVWASSTDGEMLHLVDDTWQLIVTAGFIVPSLDAIVPRGETASGVVRPGRQRRQQVETWILSHIATDGITASDVEWQGLDSQSKVEGTSVVLPLSDGRIGLLSVHTRDDDATLVMNASDGAAMEPDVVLANLRGCGAECVRPARVLPDGSTVLSIIDDTNLEIVVGSPE